MSMLDLLRRVTATDRPLMLCYHAVSSSCPSPLAVSEELLSEHVELLRKAGYVGLTFGEAERRRRRGDIPRRSVVLTFDDGFASVLRALPILDDAGYPATIFVVTRFAEGDVLDWPEIEWLRERTPEELRGMTWDDLRRLRAHGWEVGSHTVSHPWLTRLGDRELRSELEESRAAIEHHVGACDIVAYPFGAADDRVVGAALEAGYAAGCTLAGAQRADAPLRRPRIGLYASDSGVRARVKLSRTGLRLRRSTVAVVANKARSLRRTPPRQGGASGSASGERVQRDRRAWRRWQSKPVETRDGNVG